MNYGVLLLLIGIAQAFLGLSLGGFGWLLLWPAISFAVVGLAYRRRGAGVFGKQPDGTLAGPNVILLLPFLLLTWIVWFLQTRFSREAVCQEVAPGLWLGRRASAKEMPPSVRLIVDLTAEFPEPRALRSGRDYLCLPTLDHECPDPRRFHEAVQAVASFQGGVYIHCALGHGRSALLAAAVLVARGTAETVAQAITHIKAVRPAVKLSASQWAFLQRWGREDVRPS